MHYYFTIKAPQMNSEENDRDFRQLISVELPLKHATDGSGKKTVDAFAVGDGTKKRGVADSVADGDAESRKAEI